MYDAVYSEMVEAGVAELLDKEIMYNANGNETTDVTKMVGRPIKYRIANPTNLLLFDETGCNTNQKDDGYVGRETFVLSASGDDCGVPGATSDIHFSILCFTSRIGDPVFSQEYRRHSIILETCN
jgi:hypothetical protein